MCIIAAIEKGHTIAKENFDACYESNPDGFGMMYVKDGKIVVRKTLTGKENAWSQYNFVTQSGFHNDSPVILHFRIGTSGGNTIGNCHPFFINPKSEGASETGRIAFCHNGIIGKGSATKSDTVLFNETILSKIENDLYVGNTGAIKLVEAHIGASNKLCFLNDKGEVTIANKTPWVKEGGIMYSNRSYKPWDTSAYEWDKEHGYRRIGGAKGVIKAEAGKNTVPFEKKCAICTKPSAELGHNAFPTILFNSKTYHICPDCSEYMTVKEVLIWSGAIVEPKTDAEVNKELNITK